MRAIALAMIAVTVAGCQAYPAATARIDTGACSLATDADTPPDSGVYIDENGAEASGRATIVSDADAAVQIYKIEGPAMAQLSVSRANQTNTADLIVPAGKTIEIRDERSVVRCIVN